MSAYADWIAKNVGGEPTLGKCKGWSERMAADFPELRLVRGHYMCPIWGKRGHWWCESPDGRVFAYLEWVKQSGLYLDVVTVNYGEANEEGGTVHAIKVM